MIRRFILITAGLCLAALTIRAQQVSFCSSYSDNGVPKDPSTSWKLGKNGGYIYIIYAGKGKHIKSKSLNIYILKQNNTAYMPYEKKLVPVRSTKNWAVLDYQFIEPGNYEVVVKDYNNKELASNHLSIHMPNEERMHASGYYHAVTRFSKVVDGVPADSGTVLAAGQVEILVVNNKSLATDSITIDIFKKGYQTEKYSIYVATKVLVIQDSDRLFRFYYSFDQSGQYKVSAYNRKGEKISDGYVTIR